MILYQKLSLDMNKWFEGQCNGLYGLHARLSLSKNNKTTMVSIEDICDLLCKTEINWCLIKQHLSRFDHLERKHWGPVHPSSKSYVSKKYTNEWSNLNYYFFKYNCFYKTIYIPYPRYLNPTLE